MKALFAVRCGGRDPRETALRRADALREAALTLSLGDGIAITGREYQLLDEIWRMDP